MIDKDRLGRQAAEYGISLSGRQLDLLDRYAEILVRYNEKVNLTAITDPRGIAEKHFLDSLIFAKNPRVAGALADVGSGAGFPGVVALIYKPEIRLTAIDSLGKRCDFLRYLGRRLGLSFEILKERAEEAPRKGYREVFDIVTARAVAGLPVLAEYCLPLVKPGGRFIAMKGREDETSGAKRAVRLLGGKILPSEEYRLPTAGRRRLIVCEKISPTPKIYPRAGGKIKKSPL